MFSRKSRVSTVASTTRRNLLASATRGVGCAFEAMEQRQLMSVSLSEGVLMISGTAGNDRVTMQNFSGNKLRVNDNGSNRDFNASSVRTVLVSLVDGNDSFNAYAVGKPMTILGGNGNDTCFGGSASDMIQGGEGNDILNGYEGADLLMGNNGTDEVQYFQSPRGVNVTLDGIANDGQYSPDNAFANIEFDNVTADVENVSGSIYNDFLFGNASNNTLNGYYGNDFIDGGAGNDGLSGGYGDDTVQGGDGNDWMWGGLGADLFNGGNGTDDVRYDTTDHTGGVTASLPSGGDYAVSSGNGMAGENDRIRGNVENLVGSYYNDHLYGNASGNGISGMNGDDWISAGGGNDWVNGNTGNDTLYGDGGNDFVWGEQGADAMSGGAGWDDVRYDDSWHNTYGSGVNARLTMWYEGKSGNGHTGENDTIYEDFESLIGTNYGDVLTGNANGNYINGAAGNDFISGKGGDDTIECGAGADWAWGDEGNDTLLGVDGSYADHLDGGAGYDTVVRDHIDYPFLVNVAIVSDVVSNAEVVR